MVQAEPSPFEERTLKEITVLCRNTGRAATTLALSTRLRIPESTQRWHLRNMEQRGFIIRRGARGGWLPAPPPVWSYVIQLPLPFPRWWWMQAEALPDEKVKRARRPKMQWVRPRQLELLPELTLAMGQAA